MPLCEPPAHDGSSENTLVNPSPPLRKAQGRPVPPLEGEGNSLSLRERVRVRVGIFIAECNVYTVNTFRNTRTTIITIMTIKTTETITRCSSSF